MTTIASLITEALALARGPDLSTPAFYYFKQAIRDIAKNQLGPVMPWKVETSIALAADTAYVSLPSNFCRPISVRLEDETSVLKARHPAAFYQDGWPESNDGEPTECAIEGTDRIMLNGTVSEATSIVLVYQKYPDTPAAVEEESPLPVAWDDVVVARVIALIFLDQRDELHAKWEATYLQRLGEILNLSHLPQLAATFSKTMVIER